MLFTSKHQNAERHVLKTEIAGKRVEVTTEYCDQFGGETRILFTTAHPMVFTVAYWPTLGTAEVGHYDWVNWAKLHSEFDILSHAYRVTRN